MTDSAGRRAAAAAIVLVVVWIATYWMWEPGDGGAGVSFENAPPAVVIGEPERPAAIDPAQLRERPVVVDPVVEPAADAQGVAVEQSRAGPRLEAPRFREYTVRQGDQIMTIAQRVYGSTRHWQAIAKANPNVDPQKLRAGQTLRVPEDPENVQGVVVGAGEPETPTASEPERIEHIVQNNDSLWKIAASFYGDGTKWRIIRDANRELVGDDGSRLRPGMTIVIPPAPNEAR